MSRAALWVGAMALLGLVFALGLLWTGNEVAPGPVAVDTPAPPPAAAQPGPATATAPEPVREPAGPRAGASPDEVIVEFPQGLQGRVVDGRDRPLAGVWVYLIESALNEPLTLPVLRRQGLLMGPIAETRSSADGRFALGLRLASDRLYEVRLVSPYHADAVLGGLRVLPLQWHDLGTIVMVPGTTVRGSVAVEGTRTAVPGATVTIEAGSAFADAMLRSIPGREDGLAAQTATDGTFEIRNAPASGVVRISAVAPGFARVVESDVDLAAKDAVEVHFALPPGQVLRGRVADPDGRPIRNARLEAWPQDRAVDPCIAHSQADGTFAVVGLRPQPHRLRAIAHGYLPCELVGIAGNTANLLVTLQPCALAAVRVVTPRGRLLTTYRAGLRRWFPGRDDYPDQVGRVPAVPDQRVRLSGLQDRFELEVPATGRFVVQVAAEGWAKTLSAPFLITAETGRLEVDVEVVPGATLLGTIVDEQARPLPGAIVTTQIDGAAPDNPFERMLARAAPDRITARTATTAADGRFLLEQLAYGAYQLQIDHPDACRGFVRGIALDASTRRELGTVQLEPGAVVFGRATAGGRVPGQAKVVLSTVLPENAPPAATAEAVRLETVTDSTGAFTMPRRVPPGEYELRAASVDAANGDGQALETLRQMRASAIKLLVGPGQAAVEQHIDIPRGGGN